jgi:hypothetical protein
LATLVEGTTGLDEETLAHCEHTLEFMTTCMIVNEPPHFLQILAIVLDLLNRFFKSATRNLEELRAQIVYGYRFAQPLAILRCPFRTIFHLKEVDVTLLEKLK